MYVEVNAPLYRVQSFEIVAPYTLHVRFNDQTEQAISFQPILTGALYGPLRDLALFNQVRLDPEVHTLVWPNGADFDPATLHDWPQHVQAWLARARQWERQAGRTDRLPGQRAPNPRAPRSAPRRRKATAHSKSKRPGRRRGG